MTAPFVDGIGALDVAPALDHPELMAPSVHQVLATWPLGAAVGVAPIDPDVSDTAAFCARYDVTAEVSANCVVVIGRREGREELAAFVALASTRADVNGAVRRRLGARKVSFAPVDRAVGETGMEYGGITPLGLPARWPVLLDAAVVSTTLVVVGSGVRRSKLVLPGAALAELPGTEVIEGLGRTIAGNGAPG